MISRHQPIKILGGGLAGLTAAITLKHRGYDPIVYEKQQACGLSRHGDFEGFETWNICQEPLNFLDHIGISPTFKSKAVYSFTVHFDTFDPLKLNCSDPFFHLVKRGPEPGDIDQDFQNQALASGVEIRFGYSPDADRMNVISAGPAKANAYIRGFTFKSDHEDQVHLFMNTTISETAYAYLIIWNNVATLAAVFKKNDSKSWKSSQKIAKEVFQGLHNDITDGATHYYNPHKVSTPSWAKELQKTKVIGRHHFYK